LPRVPGQATAIAFASLAAIALGVDVWLALSNVQRMTEASAWVTHSHRVLEQAQELLSSLKDAETGQRGFLITADPAYRKPYEAGKVAARQHYEELADLTRDNAGQRQGVRDLGPLVDAKLAELERTVALRESGPGGFDAARAIVLGGEGLRLMETIRAKLADVVATEQALLAARNRESSQAAHVATATALAGFVASLVLVGAAILSFRRRALEREQAAALLHEEKERFRTTLSSIGDAVIVTDVRGRITLMNASASSLLGWDDSALGRPLDDVFRIENEATREPVESPVRQVLREGKVAGLANHTVLVRRDGTAVPIDDSGAPIRDAAGALVGVVLVFRDIRERREAERDLERSAQRLREQDQRKDAFLGILSHELRNPLAPILTAVAILQQVDPASPQARRAREIIDRQVTQLTRLVDDLLDVSRITEGKVRLNRERVSLGDVVRATVDDHQAQFAAKGIALAAELPAQPVWVDADPTRLVQVIGNLLENALKFTNSGGHVAVRLERGDGKAVLRVRDDGAGMDAETLAKIFQPFMQADTTLARTQGGLGLGLAVVKSLVELHGGSVEARSSGVGRGAELAVSLPRAAAPDATAAGGLGGASGPRKVLVIEDNEDAATTLRDLLELRGHQVALARDGRSGVAAALADPPDVVLCDVGLPGVDGYEVAKRLRAAESSAALVALTGYATPEDAVRAREAGFDAHLAKPPDLERLAELLATLPRT